MEILAVILAVTYLVLAIREIRWCWPAGIASSLLYLGLFYETGLYMQAALQLFYVGMAVYGWWAWRPVKVDDAAAALSIHRWPLRWHGVAVVAIVILSLVSGWLLARYTSEASPYVDSFTTWGAVVASGMLARKLLENWLYWLVVDSVTLGLILDQGLHLTAVLFALYLVLAVIGWRSWLATWKRRRPASA